MYSHTVPNQRSWNSPSFWAPGDCHASSSRYQIPLQEYPFNHYVWTHRVVPENFSDTELVIPERSQKGFITGVPDLDEKVANFCGVKELLVLSRVSGNLYTLTSQNSSQVCSVGEGWGGWGSLQASHNRHAWRTDTPNARTRVTHGYTASRASERSGTGPSVRVQLCFPLGDGGYGPRPVGGYPTAVGG